MQIEKVLNNNVVITRNEDGKESVVMGRGLGFQMKAGMQLDPKKIEKTFSIDSNNDVDARYHELIEAIPHEILLVTEAIIEHASSLLPNQLHPSVRVPLADHIHCAIERCIQGNVVKNAMLWEIKRFYATEYSIGLSALTKIKQASGIQMGDDEAGFIALHLVNSQLNDDMHNTMDITSLINDIVNLIKFCLKVDMNENCISYQRLVTHLRYFAHRLIHANAEHSDDESLFVSVKQEYPDSYNCTKKIFRFIDDKLSHKMTKEEMMFLTIHIERVRREHK
ncbi:transcriptional antiterminator of the bgl operon [Vibrio nigripulchritudo SOn1]|uniref:Transcriptional antiterminator of the bgl operon n=1 Tax=Vibrio nigripulchritudo SOn1 TaxID=1238450 RepID=A0AAV2W0Y4_9VIBR|nr:PRD domain-containing protein [Vibrio nigripulchritudo]CCO50311.1 transcriptional antiterminator of the bgl operon [Vibrio nigripulchritudo SOn1]